MTDNDALMEVMRLLAAAGIQCGLRSTSHSTFAIDIDDGFYKSDGMAMLVPEDGRLFLHTRYQQKDEIKSLSDLVAVSYQWHEYSHDRFDGWRHPPQHWQKLYQEFGFVRAAAAIGESK